MKIGVFICHCGSNIAGTVDCGKVAEIAKTYPDVAFSTDTMYTCSEPGQEEIVAAIKEHKLDGVVVASCTPRMHEPTFRRTVERAGLNKYMFEMANIREHVSWIGKDKEANTNKAAELVRIAVEKLRRDNPLFSKSFESTKRVLVIGGGVAGIQAALDCADAGLLELHPRPQDGRRRPASQNHAHGRFRSDQRVRVCGQLHRDREEEGHLCRLVQVHRLRRLHGQVPRQEDPGQVQRVRRPHHGDQHPLPAGDPQEGHHQRRILPQAHLGQMRRVRQGVPHRGHQLRNEG